MTRILQLWTARGTGRTLATCVSLATIVSCSDLLTESYQYGTVEVQAVRRTGEPVPGVTVKLYSSSVHTAYGNTDEEGRHLFRLVPGGAYGIQMIAPPEYAALGSLREDVHTDGITLGHGAETSLSVVFLKKGEGAVRVRLQEASGAPLPPVELSLYGWEGEVARVAGVQGQYTFERVPFGSYGVSVVLPSGYAMADPAADGTLDGVVVDEGWTEEVTFVVGACRGSLLVRVEDTNGEAVPGAGVSVYGWAGTVEDASTDPRGEREFDVACGSYGVILRPVMGYGYVEGRGTGYVDGLAVGRAGSESVRFVLEPCSGVVRTRVIDDAGVPVADALVRLYTGHGKLAVGMTDADGRYEFANAPCTRVGVYLFPPEGYTAVPGRGGEFFDDIEITDGSMHSFEFQVDRDD